MARKKKKVLHWVRLDNAAKIYPAARSREWSNVFRESVTLCEDVDVNVLKSALDVTVKRFPSIAAALKKGMFWFYLQQVERAPDIREEQSYPLIYMSYKEMQTCAFRVIVYNNRIAVEFFHSLTDGNGALIFLKTLSAEYLEQKYGVSIPCEDGVLDRNESPSSEELEDSFLKCAGNVPLSRQATDAWRLEKEPLKDGFINLTCFMLPVKETLALAHQHKVTVTAFFTAVMMKALIELQKEKVPNISKRKMIKVLLPVNLRPLFPSKTLRNFVMYTTPELDPRLGEYTFDEICTIIKCKMGAEITPKFMSSLVATNVNDELNPFLRIIPLPIKNIAMKAVFDSVGERKSSLTLSNLGVIKMPEEMRRYVERMDFILGVQSASPYNCGMLSFGDTIYFNFIRSMRDAGLERHFFKILQEMGLPVTVDSNRGSMDK